MQVTEHEALSEARERALQVGPAPSPAVCSLLRWATAQVSAKHAVVVGSRCGVAGLAVLDGMAVRSVLTTIEGDPHQHGMTRDAYGAVGVQDAVRLIQGPPLDVLDRLTDDGYELVVVTTTGPDASLVLDQAARLLVTGGIFIAMPMDGDGDDLFATSLADERFLAAAVPLDEGLVIATRLADEDTDA